MADGGRNLPEVVAKELATIIGMVHAVINEGHLKGIFVKVEPLVLHLMVVGGISYFKTSGPARNKYFETIGAAAGAIKDPNGLDFKSEIEKIILRAILK